MTRLLSFMLTILLTGGRVSGLASRQDGTQFEDALRRLYALEKKLTDQVMSFKFVCEIICMNIS